MSGDNGPKVLLFDIETSPILAHVWGLWDQNIALNQIEKDWSVLAWAAKWLGSPAGHVMYDDTRNQKDIRNDKRMLGKIWDLLDQADIVITQNGRKFDSKKLNSRFIIHGMQPPSSFKHIDTLILAKKHFGFTSNKLEYMTDKLCIKFKKLKHKKFPGFELWTECLKGNSEAWAEMEEYNKHDVLSLEELYTKLIPWDSSVNFNLYHDEEENICKCGANDWKNNGHAFTSFGKYQRFKCLKCGAEMRSGNNKTPKEKRKCLMKGTIR